ncbi:MAG: hypothetical protein CSB55_03180 [Candidatus Cloacimonadota bacterium]|nr:MAG: hypothetical protein CSB55_03180 [Candidatus Cloacimonadota bacterium]
MVLEKIQKITQYIQTLPVLPAVMSKLLDLFHDPDTSASDIEKLVSSEPALSAKILKLANSSFYGCPNEIVSVKHAVSMLGFNNIMNLALSISIVKKFKAEFSSARFDLFKFWEHSLQCGITAKKIALETNLNDSNELFTIGILHDIGKLIIYEYVNAEYEKIEKLRKRERLSSVVAEKKILGTDHAEIGYWLCKNWNLPEQIGLSILYHHDCLNAEKFKKISFILHFSDYLVNKYLTPFPDDNFAELSDPDKARDELNLKYCIVSGGKKIIDWDYYNELMVEELENSKEFLQLFKI